MKSRCLLAGLTLFVSAAVVSQQAIAEPFNGKLVTDDQKYSYYMGLEFGSALRGATFKVDHSVIDRAIKDVLAGGDLLLSRDEAIEVRAKLAKQLQEQRIAKVKADSDKNQKEGEAFLKKNLKEKGVKATSSGLQYKILKKGKGARPSAMDQVTVHYTGTRLDGTVFDSSYKRDKPMTIPLSGVIPGWTEGVQLMNVGSKYQFFIPPKLAYGKKGAGGLIGPESTLIFEVELLEIK
ncbi:MAG: FKBP-type peptidyl-prolyl cis-trans isomerase [Magnetococcales bacterium]|nr:FKBP-type peptidyl-prolyl cis-trans isomerase [Magnetococcales bacterium]